MAEKKGGEPKAEAARLKRECGFKEWPPRHQVASYDFKWGISGN